MAKRNPKRILMIAIVVETLLMGLMVFLIAQVKSGAMQSMTTPEELIGRISGTIGACMGVMFVIFALQYFIAIKSNRNV